jgi:hypothetical protein
MLRRHPTAIKLTTNDLAVYENSKHAQKQHHQENEKGTNPHDQPQMPATGAGLDPKARQRAREERIGLGRQ